MWTKWKSFNDHLLAVFRDLGEEGHFADVTLVCDDQIQTPAHKVVLSACSPVLKTLLVNNPHSNPLLYLRGIKHTELQALLKFMYVGETQVHEEKLEALLSVAKDLEIKDLFKKNEQNIIKKDFHEEIREEVMDDLECAETQKDIKPVFRENEAVYDLTPRLEAQQLLQPGGILSVIISLPLVTNLTLQAHRVTSVTSKLKIRIILEIIFILSTLASNILVKSATTHQLER